MSHVTYEWVMSHMNESCHIWMSHVTYEWVMSHVNQSYHEWMYHAIYASYHIWMSHVTYEWVISHMHESCHIWISHVTYEWDMSHINCITPYIRHTTYKWVMSSILIERTPTPRGGFLFTMFPHQEPCVRETPLEGFVPDSSRGSLLHTVLDEGT